MAKIDKEKLKEFGKKYWKDAAYLTALLIMSWLAFKNCSGDSEEKSVQHKYSLVNCPIDTTRVERMVTKDGKIVVHELYFDDCLTNAAKDTVLYNVVKRDSIVWNVKHKNKVVTNKIQKYDTVHNKVVLNDTVYRKVVLNDTLHRKVVLNDTLHRTILKRDTIHKKFYITDTVYNRVPAQKEQQTEQTVRPGVVAIGVSTYSKGNCK